MSLTEKGRKRLGISDAQSDRHGGPEHRYWCTVLADHLKAQGYEVAVEVPIGGGKTIDLVTSKGGQQIAFEIETGKSDAAANVRKCLEAGFEKVIVAATSLQIRQVLAEKLAPHQHVEVLTGSDVMKRLGEGRRPDVPSQRHSGMVGR